MYYFNMLLWLSEVDSLSCGCARPHVYSQSLPSHTSLYLTSLLTLITRVETPVRDGYITSLEPIHNVYIHIHFFFVFLLFKCFTPPRAYILLTPSLSLYFFSPSFFRFLFLSLCSGRLSTSRILTIGGEHRLLHNAWESKAITESSFSISETEI